MNCRWGMARHDRQQDFRRRFPMEAVIAEVTGEETSQADQLAPDMVQREISDPVPPDALLPRREKHSLTDHARLSPTKVGRLYLKPCYQTSRLRACPEIPRYSLTVTTAGESHARHWWHCRWTGPAG